VPEVLLSGNHEAIRRFRLRQQVRLTLLRRPDLIAAHWETYPPEVVECIRQVAQELGLTVGLGKGENSA
jgi:tRNA (guanine37-N1)-methyltransferase